MEAKLNNYMMENLIKNFPLDLKDALDMPTPFPTEPKDIENIVFVGMGGSGIGAVLVQNWFKEQIGVPITTCQDYTLPKFVNQKTLVVACSYSGNTEETLSAIEQASSRKAVIHGITSGGILAKFCEDNNYSCSLVPSGFPPRTQLAYMCVSLTKVMIAHNLDSGALVNSLFFAYRSIVKEQDSFREEARKIADIVKNKRLIIYTDSRNEALAIRAKQQFQENAKILCSHHVIPEMNHNELVGWAGGSSDIAVLFLRTTATHKQNEKRFSFTRDVVTKYTDSVYTVQTKAEDPIVSSLQMIHIVDWASLYLAEVNNIDSIEIDVIKSLKEHLLND